MSKITPLPVLALGSGPSGPTGVPIIFPDSDTEALNQPAVTSAAFMFAYNPVTGFWERVESATAAADGWVPVVNGNVLTIAQLFGLNAAGNFDRIWARPNNADGLAAETTGNLASDAFLYAFNGTTFDRIRAANIYHNVVTAAAGLTAVWTPTAGKKFRLMGYTISVAGTIGASGPNTIQLRDGAATVIKTHLANMIQTPTANISGGDTQIGADLGQGQLSAAANNVLNVNVGTALGSGGVAVNVWGTEE